MEQTERAFLRQSKAFYNGKKVFASAAGGSKVAGSAGVIGSGKRYHKSVGLGFKTPKEAIEGTYVDNKCPFTGDVSIRGRILTGTVIKKKMQKTVVVRRDYLHFVRKYRRYERRHKNISVHCSPAFAHIQPGDSVVVGQCRPLSKTVRFNVLKIAKAKGGKKLFKKY